MIKETAAAAAAKGTSNKPWFNVLFVNFFTIPVQLRCEMDKFYV